MRNVYDFLYCMDEVHHGAVLHSPSSSSKQALFQVMSSEKALLCLAIRDERDGERTSCWSSPAGRLGTARWKSRAGSQKAEGGIITSRTLVMQVLDLIALRLPGGWGPQSALGEPGMGAPILLIFGERLLLHQRHIVLERHRLSIQALDWNRLDTSSWLPDVEALLGGVHPAGDQVFQPSFGSHRNLLGWSSASHSPGSSAQRLADWSARASGKSRPSLERSWAKARPDRPHAAAGCHRSVPGWAARCWSGRDTRKFAQRPPRASLADARGPTPEAPERWNLSSVPHFCLDDAAGSR